MSSRLVSRSTPTTILQLEEEQQSMEYEEYDQTYYNGADFGCKFGKRPLAASLQCGRFQPPECPTSNVDENGLVLSVPLNRKCTAKPSSNRLFFCYDMDPTTFMQEYFSHYDKKSASREYTPCSVTVTNTTNNNNNEDEDEIDYYSLKNDNSFVYNGALRHEYGGSTAMYSNETHSVYYGTASQQSQQQQQEFDDYNNDGVLSSNAFSASLAASTIVLRSIHLSTKQQEDIKQYKCKEKGCRVSEFCGYDSNCHTINCPNFYRYGEVDFTGRQQEQQDEDSNSNSNSHNNDNTTTTTASTLSSPFLACSNVYGVGEEAYCPPADFPASVQYYCELETKETYFGRCGDPPSWYLVQNRLARFDRYCHAEPVDGSLFECYDMMGGSTSSIGAPLRNYLDSVESNPGCGDATTGFYDETELRWIPRHSIEGTVVGRNKRDVIGFGQFSFMTRSEFDVGYLDFALFSRLKGEGDSSGGGGLMEEEEEGTAAPITSGGGDCCGRSCISSLFWSVIVVGTITMVVSIM
eukprot:CAMPEP_0118683520 /NCGR_PEP_ID=MMETSP0800-20121206/6099_1 /TAXON_ID=210618 ORGANISM="Striatella unipunctata, Strain CCMP2910" /NCGR_SAMPLE_ID=MMETSP0800 /ASSEMBLY_ACC=CAM_ASM_000638 /LENGTH=521 /DNA_ID=CAMNT_0006580055 /DNA_START=330 /DNA_END=1895 /DNA_ORIENTATION=+